MKTGNNRHYCWENFLSDNTLRVSHFSFASENTLRVSHYSSRKILSGLVTIPLGKYTQGWSLFLLENTLRFSDYSSRKIHSGLVTIPLGKYTQGKSLFLPLRKYTQG